MLAWAALRLEQDLFSSTFVCTYVYNILIVYADIHASVYAYLGVCVCLGEFKYVCIYIYTHVCGWV